MVNFIAISEKSVINLDHVTAINAYSEKSDIEVFLLNGSSLTFKRIPLVNSFGTLTNPFLRTPPN